MRAVELNGEIDAEGRLHLDETFHAPGRPQRVEVLVLFRDDPEIDEQEWLLNASKSPSFAFLHDPEEDIYSLSDGKPFTDER